MEAGIVHDRNLLHVMEHDGVLVVRVTVDTFPIDPGQGQDPGHVKGKGNEVVGVDHGQGQRPDQDRH